MKVLKHRFGTKLEESAFDKLIESFSTAERPSLSIAVGKLLSRKFGTSFHYRGIRTGGLFGRSGRGDAFVERKGVLIFEFERSQSGEGGILSLATAIETHIDVTAFAKTHEEANGLLVEASSHIYRFLQQEPPSSAMVNPKTLYFVAEEEGRHIEYLQKVKDGAEFKAAKYDQSDLELSNALTNRLVREFVFRLIQSRYLPEAKFAEELSAFGDAQVREVLDGGGFIDREIFVQCRQTSQNIAHFRDKELRLDSLNIRCTNCNRNYKDEKIYLALVASDKLKEVVKSSRWMNILITKYLVENDVPQEFILWNVTFGTNEIDIMAFINGEPWIFELKDREFSASDAHHFNYRRSIVKPAQAIVVTTTIVSPDAKRVFEDVSGEVAGATILTMETRLPKPVLIEGLESAEEILRKLLNEQEKRNFGLSLGSAINGINWTIANLIVEGLASAESVQDKEVEFDGE